MSTPSSSPAEHLLFSAAKALDPARHGHWKVRADADYRFAQHLPTLPITAPEFVYAARDFPIVFAGEQHQPVIVTSFREQQNLLVDEQGQWRANRYVPLHLKRYPFILHEVPTEQRFAVCIDENPEYCSATVSGEALFNGAEPSGFTQQRIQLLGEMQAGIEQTQRYIEALRKEGLLTLRQVSVTLKSGEQSKLDGLYTIDEEKLTRLPDATLLEWARQGWLALSYFQLQSRLNWQHLLILDQGA